eukprot:PLAT6888.5.p1 GENE.PLAT6888.5~~PLAT6888.5.p1  ORF type:complete len:197 (-),score=52.50 PLAT6888.5:109-699(-)
MKYAGLPGVPRAMAVSLPTAEGKRYLAVGDSSHRVSLFRVKDGSLKWKWKADHGHGSAITAVAWGKNERSHVFFTGGVDKRIKVWQIKPDKAQKQDGNVLPAQTLRAHKARICDLVVNDNLLFSASINGNIRVWHTSVPYHCVCVYRVNIVGYLSGLLKLSSRLAVVSSGGELQLLPLFQEELAGSAVGDAAFFHH